MEKHVEFDTPEKGTGVTPFDVHPGYTGDVSKFIPRRKRYTGESLRGREVK